MNRKEIAEIRRRFKTDNHAIRLIRGCYVNDNREIISSFACSPAALPAEEHEKYLNIFRRTLAGMPGKNLLELRFAPDQVMNGEQHALLRKMRDSALEDDESVTLLFSRIIESCDLEGNYVILLTHDTYDVPFKRQTEESPLDESDEVFTYLLCSICPVKLTPQGLCYDVEDNAFHENIPDWIVTGPEIGFLFPAFEDRAANIYTSLYYSKNADDLHEDLVASVFGTELPMAAHAQQETFTLLLEDALGEGLDLSVVENVHETLCDRIESHKKDSETAAPTVSKAELLKTLEESGVEEPKLERFERSFDAAFGASGELYCKNIINPSKLEVRTPDVTIQINPERNDLLETRVIDGQRWIMIRAEDGVLVNGVSIGTFDK